MYFNITFSSLLILFLFLRCSAQGQNATNSTSSSNSATTTSSETTKSFVSQCPGGHINFPDCTKCAVNYENKDDKCFSIKNEVQPSRSTGRRIFLIFLACFLTVALLLAMLIVYGRVNQQRRRRSSSNPGNSSNSSTVNDRFNNILRSIGLNKRGRFNFFSISNNNPSGGQYRQPDTSRAHLNENPDEALLFDDPYADGGLNNASANPYKSLTLAVT